MGQQVKLSLWNAHLPISVLIQIPSALLSTHILAHAAAWEALDEISSL